MTVLLQQCHFHLGDCYICAMPNIVTRFIVIFLQFLYISGICLFQNSSVDKGDIIVYTWKEASSCKSNEVSLQRRSYYGTFCIFLKILIKIFFSVQTSAFRDLVVNFSLLIVKRGTTPALQYPNFKNQSVTHSGYNIYTIFPCTYRQILKWFSINNVKITILRIRH